MPSKIHIPVAPFRLMPPHTCTFKGCFGLQYKLKNNRYYDIKLLLFLPRFRLGLFPLPMAGMPFVRFHLD